MEFRQQPPTLGNQYLEDRAFRAYLRRSLSPATLEAIEPECLRMGDLAGGEFYRQQLAERAVEPRHIAWDAWGVRVDRIEVTPLWQRAAPIAARAGLVALPYDKPYGRESRIAQFALVHLFTPSTDLYSCPLAMSDGAARALLDSGNEELLALALPRLASRDPEKVWTSGQWMTELGGGSDVGTSRTEARRDAAGRWRLYGRKWFTSAIASQMALTLARTEAAETGGRGLSLFYVETRDAAGLPNGMRVERLKDKLGTRKVPTAELTLDGAIAVPVAELGNGVRRIAPMLNVTRTWNAVCAVAYMRRGVALARSYAARRSAFGARLLVKPLHVDTLADLECEYRLGLELAFAAVELLGRIEAGEASERHERLFRLLAPVAKLVTGRQAVAVATEVVEAFGGAGYVEDTGIPLLLRDSQVFPIWEGTTNVLALDAIRSMVESGAIADVQAEVGFVLAPCSDARLLQASAIAQRRLERCAEWLAAALDGPPAGVESGARRLCIALGRGLAFARLIAAAQHAIASGDADDIACALAAVRRIAASERTTLMDHSLEEASALARGAA